MGERRPPAFPSPSSRHARALVPAVLTTVATSPPVGASYPGQNGEIVYVGQASAVHAIDRAARDPQGGADSAAETKGDQ
jgi:hypothetical protein